MAPSSLDGDHPTSNTQPPPADLPVATSSRRPGVRRTASAPEGQELKAADEIYTAQTAVAIAADNSLLDPAPVFTRSPRHIHEASTHTPSSNVPVVAQAQTALHAVGQQYHRANARSSVSRGHGQNRTSTHDHYVEATAADSRTYLQRACGTFGAVPSQHPGAAAMAFSEHPIPHVGAPHPVHPAHRFGYDMAGPAQSFGQQPIRSNQTHMAIMPSHQCPGPGNIGFENLPPGTLTHDHKRATGRQSLYQTVNNTEKAERYAAEFSQLFGSSVDDLGAWQKLTVCCGLSPYDTPGNIEDCKNFLKTVYVNLFDLVDARRVHGVVPRDRIFRTGGQLKDYCIRYGKVCPADSGQGNELWKFMLKRWYARDAYEGSSVVADRK